MRRSLPLLLALATGAAGLAVAAPAASAAPAAPAAAQAHEAVPDQLLVGYVAGASESARERARGRAGAAREDVVVEAAADRTAVELVRLPPGRDRGRAIADLQADPAVRYAEPNFVYRSFGKPTPAPTTAPDSGTTTTAPAFVDPRNEPDFTAGKLWGLGATATVTTDFGSRASAAWPSSGPAPAPVYVGVIDEGIQHTHPDLTGQVGNPAEIPGNGKDDDRNRKIDDAYGWDFAGRNNTVYDGGTAGTSDDHGTHVAGTIAAKADGKNVVGVAPYGVKMISGKFLGPNGGSLSDATAAVDYFTDLKVNRKVNIVATNNSWGGGGYSTTLHEAIQRGVNAGILFIAAAGNAGVDNNASNSYPSDYDTGTRSVGGAPATTVNGVPFNGVVGVSAIDSKGQLASFSNYGHSEVHIGAPGVGVLSTTTFNGWSSYNGTSMATPHVAGGVAVLGAYKPLTGTPIEIAKQRRDAILGSAAPTDSLKDKVASHGRLDVQAALAR